MMALRSILSGLVVEVRNPGGHVHVMGVQFHGLVSNQGKQNQNAEPHDTHKDETSRQVMDFD